MLGRSASPKQAVAQKSENGQPMTLLTVVGGHARMEGKFEIADSIQIECEVGGELNVGGKLVIGEKGVVTANVQTVDAIIKGQETQKSPRPVYPVEEKRVGQQK